jgi:hypothetical protein
VEVARIDGAVLNAAGRTAAEVRASGASTAGIRAHLDQQVRNGRLVDERNVRETRVPDPYFPDKTIDIVFEDGIELDTIIYEKHTDRQGSVGTGMGTGSHERPGVVVGRSLTPSAGYSAYVGDENMDVVGGPRCVSYEWGPGFVSANNANHRINSCYEKHQRIGTEYYVYNRWADVNRATPSLIPETAYITDFTIRSRPWAGKESRIGSLIDWQPKFLQYECMTVATIELSKDIRGIQTKVTIPFTLCRDFVPKMDAGRKMIAIDLYNDGETFIWSSRPHYRLDMAGQYLATTTTTGYASWADRNWLAVQWCSLPRLLCDPSVAYEGKDSGW